MLRERTAACAGHPDGQFLFRCAALLEGFPDGLLETLSVAVDQRERTRTNPQQEFADRLGMSIATVVRYEHNRVPRGKALARLEQAATAGGFDEYAALFRSALTEEFSVPPPSP